MCTPLCVLISRSQFEHCQDEIRLCGCPGLCQRVFLPSGKCIRKPSKIVVDFLLLNNFSVSTIHTRQVVIPFRPVSRKQLRLQAELKLPSLKRLNPQTEQRSIYMNSTDQKITFLRWQTNPGQKMLYE